MRSSKAAFDLIVSEEVSSRETYKKKYQRPEWPGEQSGATIGIGYDLGQTDAGVIRADWGGLVPPEMLAAMVSASGKTGAAGKKATAQIRNQVLIPWDLAIGIHEDAVVPRWEAKLEKALPNTDLLSPDCFGALLSLIFNRGTSFNLSGERYKEMRAIKAHMKAKNFQQIPAEIRAMKRLWPKSAGLRKRRDKEANLFEKGLQANTEQPHDRQSNEIEDVQRRLDKLGYHEVGMVDGKWGGRTAGAIAAFKNDRHISGPAVIDATLLSEIAKAEGEQWARPIAKARSEATPDDLAKKLPEVKEAQRASFWSKIQGWWSAIFGGVTATGVATNFIEAKETVDPVKSWFGENTTIAIGIVFVVAAVVVAIILAKKASGAANSAADETTKAYQEGARA